MKKSKEYVLSLMWTKRQYIFAGMLIGVGLGCLLGFKLAPATIDEQGFLQEPFALLPLGWMFLAVGVGLLVFFLGKVWRNAKDI